MIKFKKYRKLFVTLSILSYCGAPYSNIIQAMEQVKETSESKKLSIDLLKKILEFENFTDTKKQEIIESSIVRLRRNIGIPKKRLKINVKDLPILFQYTVLETCNSLLESDNEFRNLIQRSYLENTNHQFAILGVHLKYEDEKITDILNKYLAEWNLKHPKRPSETISGHKLGEVLEAVNCSAVTFFNRGKDENSILNDARIGLAGADYADGSSMMTEMQQNLKMAGDRDKILLISYLIFVVLHEFAHLLHECKCVVFNRLGVGSKDFTWFVKFEDYMMGKKIQDLFPKSVVARNIFNYVKEKNCKNNLFTEYGLKPISDNDNYSEFWADSFALKWHPLTNKHYLRDQFVDDFFHLENQYDKDKFQKQKQDYAKGMKNSNDLTHITVLIESYKLLPVVDISQDSSGALRFHSTIYNTLFQNQVTSMNNLESRTKFSDEDISYFES